VEQQIALELKAVENLLPIHSAQLISYLRLGNYPLGYLLNFHSLHMRHGIKRIINQP
jgi:GxxExxY protein